jgi:oxygen-dependent protoporphyrinogen oxidase
MKRVIILGAGISGLSLAHRLFELQKEKGGDFEVFLFEKEGRAGGNIETLKQDGFLIEKGPDSFLSEKPSAIDLCRRLGLDGEVIGTEEKTARSFSREKTGSWKSLKGFISSRLPTRWLF